MSGADTTALIEGALRPFALKSVLAEASAYTQADEPGDAVPLVSSLGQVAQRLADALEASEARSQELTERIEALRRDVEYYKWAPLGDNHHNAAACPYCRPALVTSDTKEARDA